MRLSLRHGPEVWAGQGWKGRRREGRRETKRLIFSITLDSVWPLDPLRACVAGIHARLSLQRGLRCWLVGRPIKGCH